MICYKIYLHEGYFSNLQFLEGALERNTNGPSVVFVSLVILYSYRKDFTPTYNDSTILLHEYL